MTERESNAVEIEIVDEERDRQAEAADDGDDGEIGPDTEVEILGFEADVEADDGAGAAGAAAAEAAVGEETAPADDAEEVETLRQEIADLRDRSMRTLADFDNYRKRAERERAEIRRYAGSEMLRDFLEVVDNLERAYQAGGSGDELRTGVEMILRQVEDVLRRHGVERVPAKGERFDPVVHEAVSRQVSDDAEEPTVVDEMQAGYRYHDRLLRPAMVVVAVPPDEGD